MICGDSTQPRGRGRRDHLLFMEEAASRSGRQSSFPRTLFSCLQFEATGEAGVLIADNTSDPGGFSSALGFP